LKSINFSSTSINYRFFPKCGSLHLPQIDIQTKLKSKYDLHEKGEKMNIKKKFRRILDKSIEYIQTKWINSEVEIFLKASLAGSQELSDLNDPMAYITNLRKFIEPLDFNISSIKYDNQQKNDTASLRFSNLIKRLQYHTPPIPFPIAKTIAKYADEYFGNLSSFEFGEYAADVAEHFRKSSSTGHKARFLATVVRFMRPKTCLELGTCYGMSAVVIISMLRAMGDFESFDTIDGFEVLNRCVHYRKKHLLTNLVNWLPAIKV
jgi:hypothetical protein